MELLDRYREHIALLPDAREVIESLRDRYTLVIASNAARMFVEKELGETGLSGFFSRVVSATSDYGMVKREERFFRRLLARSAPSRTRSSTWETILFSTTMSLPVSGSNATA